MARSYGISWHWNFGTGSTWRKPARRSMPAKRAAVMSGARESSEPRPSVSAREWIRRGLATSLYTTGALGVLRRFEGTRRLHSSPASRWPAIRRFAGSKFGILCYHRVGVEGVPLFSRLDPRVFEAQMKYV